MALKAIVGQKLMDEVFKQKDVKKGTRDWRKSELAGAGGRSVGNENGIFMLQDASHSRRTDHLCRRSKQDT